MDNTKCQLLKDELADQPEPQLVPIARFFDGNDDPGSIGCNLSPHPGVPRFQKILTSLLTRPDVQAVYAQISELDPGEESWPFADTVLVVGPIETAELQAAVDELEPDEIGSADDFGLSPDLAEQHGSPVTVIWWD